MLKNISSIENTGRIHMYLICEAIMGNNDLRERIALKYVEWRTTLEKQISQIITDKSHAKGASFILMSIVDGLVIQALLKGEKIP